MFIGSDTHAGELAARAYLVTRFGLHISTTVMILDYARTSGAYGVAGTHVVQYMLGYGYTINVR